MDAQQLIEKIGFSTTCDFDKSEQIFGKLEKIMIK